MDIHPGAFQHDVLIDIRIFFTLIMCLSVADLICGQLCISCTMILSSCRCKVSWALRGGMQLLREPPGFHGLQVVLTTHKTRRGQQLIRRSFLLNICCPLAEKLHRSLSAVRFYIYEYSSRDEGYERLGLSPNSSTWSAIHRSVARSCYRSQREVVQRKLCGTPRRSRYSCLAFSRCSSVGAVLY